MRCFYLNLLSYFRLFLVSVICIKQWLQLLPLGPSMEVGGGGKGDFLFYQLCLGKINVSTLLSFVWFFNIYVNWFSSHSPHQITIRLTISPSQPPPPTAPKRGFLKCPGENSQVPPISSYKLSKVGFQFFIISSFIWHPFFQLPPPPTVGHLVWVCSIWLFIDRKTFNWFLMPIFAIILDIQIKHEAPDADPDGNPD